MDRFVLSEMSFDALWTLATVKEKKGTIGAEKWQNALFACILSEHIGFRSSRDE